MLTQVSQTIDLSPELVNLANEIGLNASKICENALKLAISRLQGMNFWWTGRDLNPRPPRCQRGDHARLIYPPKVRTF